MVAIEGGHRAKPGRERIFPRPALSTEPMGPADSWGRRADGRARGCHPRGTVSGRRQRRRLSAAEHDAGRAGPMGRLLPLPTHCRFPPGGQLPPWRDLAERFGVGRDAARGDRRARGRARGRAPPDFRYLPARGGPAGKPRRSGPPGGIRRPPRAEVGEVVERRRILDQQAIDLASGDADRASGLTRRHLRGAESSRRERPQRRVDL
jgi:hypothetical protein